MPKSVVGLFDDLNQAERAVEDLVDHGFARDEMSLVTNDRSRSAPDLRPLDTDTGTATAAGAAVGGIAGFVVGVVALAIPGFGPIIAVGPLAAALGGAGLGAAAGALVGALSKIGVSESEAEEYSEGVRRGGVLVAVRTADDQADRAADILDRHGAIDLEKRTTEWRSAGWTPRAARPVEGLEPREHQPSYQTGRTRGAGSGARVFIW